MSASRLWSERQGVGPPLLLLHGVGATHTDFAQVLEPLATTFEVHAVDLPGHGASASLTVPPTIGALTDAVEKHLDQVGVSTTHVLGNSLGGRLAIELAIRGRARSVLGIGPFGLVRPDERFMQGIVLAGGGIFLRVLRPQANALSRRWWGRCLILGGLRAQPWRASPAEAEALARNMGSASYWHTLSANVADVPLGLDRIACPVTLAQGTGDWVSGSQTAIYAARISGARLAWLPFAGHAAHGDTPDTVVQLMNETAARHHGRAVV